MTPVWHDGASILINGSEPYPSQSLYAEARGELIWTLAHNGFIAAALPWSQYSRQDGSGFASKADALAYLQGEYAKGGATALGNVAGLHAALDGRALKVHTHAIADVTGLQAELDGKQASGSYAPLIHTHAMADVTGLAGALAAKSVIGHVHVIADVTGLQAALDGKQPSGSYAPLSHATDTANPHAVTKAQVGLGNVDNTADLVKPISTAVQSALNAKAASVHTHVIADVTGLQAALDAKLGTAVTPSVTTRALNTTFQPHATKAVRVAYSIKTQVTNPLLIGTSTATVTLLSDTANPPTIERGRAESSSGVGITVTIALTTSNTMTLSYIVPAGHYVRLASTVTGTGTTAIVSQVEEVLG